MADAGWAWFHDPATTAISAADDLPRLFAHCFAGGDGDRALAHLRAVTLDRCLGPEVSDAALRHMEGRRQLAAAIIALVARGRGP